ncbi:HAD-IA family hydrolase [Microbispora sp. RL4-1S]|uniref:HAD-IA family hydrolase n=1 Tax=Microbispora oryzae TaxID=2806554 RepID=A0A940WV70_9ACTN|nr:HAD-IA family hydrolase [Microbispora oryzae]MBP2707796.1 HAD-IA family hydrolase [Microbispora oryzae]
MPEPTAVVLDAMGVLYESADDVGELLVPYLREHGCALDTADIEEAYRRASLGELTSAGFWEATGVAGSADDEEYCARHTLTPGVHELLKAADTAGVRVACLSNDVSRWSELLRRRFGLTESIRDWVISADIGVRKPQPAIYHEMLRRLGIAADGVWFVDDRAANVAAAREIGFTAIHYGRDVTSFDQLTAALAR